MKRALVGVAVVLISCTEALPPATSAPAPDPVHIEVRSPERVPYTPSLLGTGPTTIAVAIANRGAAPLDVSKLAVRIDAVWQGIAVECRSQAETRSREPSVLRPGEAHSFERAVDCRLPLAGRYAVTVAVAFGADRTWRTVRTYALEVTAPPELAPRALDDHGLVATIGASPAAGNAEKRGHPRVAIALANTTADGMALPPLRVETRARRTSAAWACSSTASFAAPATLAAGEIYRAPVDVSCLGFDVAGAYDVEVVLLVADRAIALGSLRIEVSDDPARVLPAPIR